MRWTPWRKRLAVVLGILLALYVASYAVISRSFRCDEMGVGRIFYYVPSYMLPDRRWEMFEEALSALFYPLSLVDEHLLGGAIPGPIPTVCYGTATRHADGSVTERFVHVNPGRAGGNSFAIIERDPTGKITKVTWQSWDAGRDARTDPPCRTEDKLPPWW